MRNIFSFLFILHINSNLKQKSIYSAYQLQLETKKKKSPKLNIGDFFLCSFPWD